MSFGTSALKLPFISTVALNVWLLPALSVTVIAMVLPGAKSVLPDTVGVASLPVP